MNNIIDEKDPLMYEVLDQLNKYIESTYSDKYEHSAIGNPAKDILLSKEGKPANIFTAIKYIQRYYTEGFAKSDNPDDLYKAIHYLLFELARRRKQDRIHSYKNKSNPLTKFNDDGRDIKVYFDANLSEKCTYCGLTIYPFLTCTSNNCPQINEDEG